ncbi:uncharacterized protein BYT42DRAFT_253325 [Radiomyces spectabilis]|uniref:uncharacterized protein n=1 Tax=Radiomyces spectabilis TaxID=64574 RepID=UPI00221FF030|nr:uncharacterized protein BYT42DRAFT_253325 [Radiomyces spectabilis]KAI8384231.1 hypothetical protein BYT42DRAFT_253325 [Radiomyces spectabilis]
MDIQGYMQQHPEGSQVLHYANAVDRFDMSPRPDSTKMVNSPQLTPETMATPVISQPSAPESGVHSPSSSSSSTSSGAVPSMGIKNDRPIHPALWLARKDKRKSSPAVLGLLGLDEEAQAQLSYQLSQHRNSIEAAMLLANFNRLPQTLSKPPSSSSSSSSSSSHLEKGRSHNPWQDDISIASQSQGKNTWSASDDGSTTGAEPVRRHSYDVNMTWDKMPPEFHDRAMFLHDPSGSQSTASEEKPSSSSAVSMPPFHTAWHNSMQDPRIHYAVHPTDPALRMVPVYPMNAEQHPAAMYHAPFPMPTMDNKYPYPVTMIHPLAQQPPPLPPPPFSTSELGQKRDHPDHAVSYYPYPYPPPHPHPHQLQPPSSSSSSSHPMAPPPPPPHYYYPGKLPLPSASSEHALTHAAHHIASTAAMKPKRKKAKGEVLNNMSVQVQPGDAEFPDMAMRDVEAARTDPEARPRRQKLRYAGDQYTPQWVRYNGQAKEGLCDTCKPGKWLQLKNSAFWYHKQFYHGISSVSGKEFLQPIETRWVDQDLVEGLCHQCHQWVSVSNVKRKNSVLWYRHAHKCHVYHKPKTAVPKRR